MVQSRPWSLVSPASRGIGLALTRHLLKHTCAPVVATIRAHNLENAKRVFLENLDVQGADERLHIYNVDVTDEATLIDTSNKLSEIFPTCNYHLRLAFCIPGILQPEKKISKVSHDSALKTFRTNALGPLLQLKHFSQFLPRRSTLISTPDADDSISEGLPPGHSVIALMSARVGSITDNKAGGWYSYRASKAAVTQLAKTFDRELEMTAAEKAMCVALHPGTVRTDFTEGLREAYEKQGRVITVHESAVALVRVATGLFMEQRGRFYDWKGMEIPP